MKIDIKQLPKSEVEMIVELDPAEWGRFVSEATRELAREVKIEGFRPGMAPKEMGEQKIGQGHKPKTKDQIKVEEKEIIDSLNWLQKSRTKYATVMRPAQKGDRVEV